MYRMPLQSTINRRTQKKIRSIKKTKKGADQELNNKKNKI